METPFHATRSSWLPAQIETLERLRAIGNLCHQDWFDLLEVRWADYQEMKMGHAPIPDAAIERVAFRFGLTPGDLDAGRVNFTEVALHFEGENVLLPDAYARAAHGRRRSSINSLDFLERFYGWRLRTEALRKLQVPESAFLDPFAPISMQFVTDLCTYLKRRQFRGQDFFDMGAYGYVSNKESMVGKIFSETRSPSELYELFFGDSMKIFERNCTYTITRMDDDGLTIEVLTNKEVAEEAGVRHLGNAHVCDFKRGIMGSMACHLGLAAAEVRETACVHRGDAVCRFEVTYPEQGSSRIRQLSS